MRFKKLIVLLFSFFTLSKGLTFKSFMNIYKDNGVYEADVYYDSENKLFGYQYSKPQIIDKLYDYKNHLLYKKGFYEKDEIDYFDDLYDLTESDSGSSEFSESVSSKSEDVSVISQKDKRDLKSSSQLVGPRRNKESSASSSFSSSSTILKSSDSSSSYQKQDTELKYKKYELKYQFLTFPDISQLIKEKAENLDYSDLYSSYLNRFYLESDVSYLKHENVDGDYSIYKLGQLVEFKINETVYILHDYKTTTLEEINEVFEIHNKSNFITTTPKCTNENDIIFLLDENGNIAEQEWVQTLEFCKKIVNRFDVKYSKSRFGIVGFGDFGVKYLDLTDSRYEIIKKLDEMKTQQLRGGVCLGCGLSIVSDMFKNKKNEDTKQILITIMAGDVDNPTYGGECIQEYKNSTYYKYCIGCCNKIEHETCEYELGESCKVENKVFDVSDQYSLSVCSKRRFNNKGYSCSDCYCNKDKKYLMCKSCVVDSFYSYARCKSSTEYIGCKSEFNLSSVYDYTVNYTESVKLIRQNQDLLKINIGIGDYKLKNKEIEDLSNTVEDLQSDYYLDSFDELNITIIDNLVSSVCQLYNDVKVEECGKDCKGFCGLNEKCYCPTCGTFGDQCLKSVCIADPKGISSTGCVIEDVKCPSDPLKKLIRNSSLEGCCQYDDIICLPRIMGENNVDYCSVGFWNPNLQRCQYREKETDDHNPCTLDECDLYGNITHELLEICKLKKPENKTIIVNGVEVIDHIVYEIDSDCYSFGNVCVPATYKKVCESLDPCVVCYGLEDGSCKCVNKEFEASDNYHITKCVNGIKVEYENLTYLDNCRQEKDSFNAYFDFVNGVCVYPEIIPELSKDQLKHCRDYTDKCVIRYPKEINESGEVVCGEYKIETKEEYAKYGVEVVCNNFDISIKKADLFKVENRILKVYDSGNYSIYKNEKYSDSLVYDSFYLMINGTLSHKLKTKLPLHKDDDKCQILTIGSDGLLSYQNKKCVDSKCYDSVCESSTGLCQYIKKEECDNIEELKQSNLKDKETKITKCSDDFGCYYQDFECPETYDTISYFDNETETCENIPKCETTDLCEISICTVSGQCLYEKVKCKPSKDSECFERLCEDGKCVEYLRFDKFSDICDDCVYKYGDLLGLYNKTGAVCYWHLTKYIKSIFDYLFVVAVVTALVVSSVLGLFISYNKNKYCSCKKQYTPLIEVQEDKKEEDENKDIELGEVKLEEN